MRGGAFATFPDRRGGFEGGTAARDGMRDGEAPDARGGVFDGAFDGARGGSARLGEAGTRRLGDAGGRRALGFGGAGGRREDGLLGGARLTLCGAGGRGAGGAGARALATGTGAGGAGGAGATGARLLGVTGLRMGSGARLLTTAVFATGLRSIGREFGFPLGGVAGGGRGARLRLGPAPAAFGRGAGPPYRYRWNALRAASGSAWRSSCLNPLFISSRSIRSGSPLKPELDCASLSTCTLCSERTGKPTVPFPFAGDAPRRVRGVRPCERFAGGDMPGSRGARRGVFAAAEPFSLLEPAGRARARGLELPGKLMSDMEGASSSNAGESIRLRDENISIVSGGR